MISPETQLTPYYKLSELTVTSTGIANLPREKEFANLKKLASALDVLRSKLGNFGILSGYRSPLVNAAVGGSSTSRHLYGDAVDITPYTKTAEKYWAEILADGSLRNMFGEISYKKPQNSIHLSLPFINTNGNYVISSSRLAEGSPMIYRSLSSSQEDSYFAKYNLIQTQRPIAASITGGIEQVISLASQTYMGKAILALGGGVFLIALVKRLKK